ncbi:MAG: glycosyltransferase family 2 protein [Kiritimatiellae bacterium]|jgi:glycosyltransferase involved in cell wall biosynthesis|nr:glycosyltransferase family 2 protein [Kiritimatiellia bacterium]
MKFSIITPSYNGAKYLRQCLESVARQTDVEVEHIVADSCSTDDTPDILKEFPNVKVICESDKGMSDGINKGLKACTGDWWMWLNTDDFLEDGALKKVQDFIERHEDADAVYGGWHFINKDDEIYRSPIALPYNLSMLIYYGCYIASTAIFYKKSATLDKGEYIQERFKQVMDQEYFVRLGTLKLKFYPMPKLKIARFRVHGNNISMRYSNSKDIDGILTRQFQLAESITVRRKYGLTPFKNSHLNAVFDCIMFFFFKGLKIAYEIFVYIKTKIKNDE